ncbi:MAG TPA: response regulator [Bryobacteraceae bacterium]
MPLQILIVDDSPAMRWFLRRVIGLSLEEVSVLEAADGREAFSLLSQSAVDLILTDINMPNMNGEEFLRKMAQDENLSSIPVIVVSADASEARMRQMLALGARRCLSKPISPEAFRRELEDVLEARNIS